MTQAQGKYNIKAAANMLNVKPGTLRAWERRYSIVKPHRNKAGHRLYTDEQLTILTWLINKVKAGFTIGQAVDLFSKKNVKNLPDTDALNGTQMQKIKQDLLIALLAFDETKANELMDHAFNVFSMEKVVITILGDMLIELEEKLEQNEITMAHKSYATSYMRTRIGMVLHHLPTNSLLPKVLCVCAPYEQNEVYLLIFTFFLRRRGYETIYIGAGIHTDNVIQVVEEITPKMIIMCSTMVEHLVSALKITDELNHNFSDLLIGLMGPAIRQLSEDDYDSYKLYLVGETEEQWITWLRRYL
ncbi:MerR family transcriptional regulator [Bacillus sp. A301a_S52]|nr:MerR family transcriptional regulator [Bacillus sp. A301a_S52]